MSQENVEIVRAFTEAFNAHDIETLVACCDPEVVFHSTFAAVGGEVYYGHDGLREWHRDLEDAWRGRIRSEPEAYFDLGQHILTFTTLHGRGKRSGADVMLPVAAVTRSRNGLLTYYRAYIHREDALSELGVSEDDLEPISP
jgi:ketosteroid isomerase-like protein